MSRSGAWKAGWGVADMKPVGSVPLVRGLEATKDGRATGGADGNFDQESLPASPWWPV